MKRMLVWLFLAALLFAGCGKKNGTPEPLPFPDLTLDARADDMAVSGHSLFWCSEGLVYRLDLTAGENAAPGDGGPGGTLFFDGFPVSLTASDGERLAFCSSGGELLVGIPGADGMEKRQSAALPLPSGGEVSGLALAGDTAVFSWRDAESGSDRVGFYNLSNGDFLEDTPGGEGRILLCGGDAGHVYICRPDSLNGAAQLFGFGVKSMKRDAIFPAEDLIGLAAIGWRAEDGCLYALDGAIGGANLYRIAASDASDGGLTEKIVPSDLIRNAPRKLLFANGSAVVLHGAGITVCREFRGTAEDRETTVTILLPDDMYCNLDRLSVPMLEKHGIRLVLKKMKTEAIDTKLLARDDDYDLWIGANNTLNLNVPVWEPLEDYPPVADVTKLLFDEIVRICTVDGHLFGLPYSMQLANCTLEWNGELAEKLGIEKPEPGWTLDDFLTLARSLRERGYYICGNAWPVTLRDYMWRYFDPYGTGELNDDGTALRKLLVWGKTLEDEGLLYPDSAFGPKDLVLFSGPVGANIVYSAGETVPDPTVDGLEIYSDSAAFLMMNPLSPHKEAASAVLAAMIDPKYGLYTSPTSLLYYYKDFSLYRWDSPSPEDEAFLAEAADEADRAEREQLIRDRGARMIEAEKRAGTYTDIWNMDAGTRDNYELYLHILANYKLGRNYTRDWLLFAQDECRLYLDSEQDLDYTVKRILERAKMVMEG